MLADFACCLISSRQCRLAIANAASDAASSAARQITSIADVGSIYGASALPPYFGRNELYGLGYLSNQHKHRRSTVYTCGLRGEHGELSFVLRRCH